MNERQKRLIEVYEHLRMYFGIHTKSGFAEALGYGRTSLSAAMNGKQEYLTDSLFQSICQKWEGVFDLDYLLTGKGNLLLSGTKDPTNLQTGANNLPDSRRDEGIDQSSLVNALLAAKDETIASLRQQIAEQKEMISLLRKNIEELRTRANRVADPYPEYTDIPMLASEP
jgi:uncharacterized coiled-coil protein SlyX